MFIMAGAMYSYGIFFKPLALEFGWTRAVTASAHSMFLILTGILFMFTGRLTDRFGPRIVLTTCGFFLGLAASIVYTARTDNLPLKVRLKRAKDSVPSGVTVGDFNLLNGGRSDERSLSVRETGR